MIIEEEIREQDGKAVVWKSRDNGDNRTRRNEAYRKECDDSEIRTIRVYGISGYQGISIMKVC